MNYMCNFIKPYIVDFLIERFKESKVVYDYIKFIDRYALAHNVIENNVEYHHIIPRSCGKQFINDPNNIVALSSKAHIIAHHFLSRTGDKRMQYAFRCMVNTRKDASKRQILEGRSTNNVKVLLVSKEYSYPFFPSITAAFEFAKIHNLIENKTHDKGYLAQRIDNKTKYCGFYWVRYEDFKDVDPTTIPSLIEQQKEERENKRIEKMLKGRVVNLNTGDVFESCKDAENFLKEKYNKKLSVSQSIRCHTKTFGCYWEYESVVKQTSINQVLKERLEEASLKHNKSVSMIVNNSNSKKKKVLCVETNQVFNSIKEAKDWLATVDISKRKYPHNISSAIKTNGTTGGYHWKYYDQTNSNLSNLFDR